MQSKTVYVHLGISKASPGRGGVSIYPVLQLSLDQYIGEPEVLILNSWSQAEKLSKEA
jgi:hypothetical protein